MTNDSDIHIDIEEIIQQSINGDKTSLDQLMASRWLEELLNGITTRQSHRFRIDRNEIRDRICDQLRKKITTIENRKKGPLTKCIKGWCNATARRFCLNTSRHRKVEERYADRIKRENSHGTRISPKGTIIYLQPATSKSPEDIQMQKEEDSLWAGRKTDLHSQVYSAVLKLPPERIIIMLLWADGLTLKEMAEQTGTPLSSIHRHLKKSQKQIVKTIGIAQLIEGDTELTEGAFQLIANCMLEMNSRGYFAPRAG